MRRKIKVKKHKRRLKSGGNTIVKKHYRNILRNNKDFEKRYPVTVNKIMGLLESFTPVTTPQTFEECEKLRNDPIIKKKIKIVKELLRVYGYEAAADDVEICNVKRYAHWVLHTAKQRIRLTNIHTREIYIDKNAEEAFNKTKKQLEHLDLL